MVKNISDEEFLKGWERQPNTLIYVKKYSNGDIASANLIHAILSGLINEIKLIDLIKSVQTIKRKHGKKHK